MCRVVAFAKLIFRVWNAAQAAHTNWQAKMRPPNWFWLSVHLHEALNASPVPRRFLLLSSEVFPLSNFEKSLERAISNIPRVFFFPSKRREIRVKCIAVVLATGYWSLQCIYNRNVVKRKKKTFLIDVLNFAVRIKDEHGVWKSQKKSHSTLRAKRATFTFWVDKS